MKKGSLSGLKWKKKYTYFKNIVFDEKDLNEKGAKFQIVKFKQNTSIGPHYHKKVHEIFYVRSGNGILKLNDKKFRCKPDDFFLCRPNDLHEFINDTSRDFTILIFKTNEEKGDIHWKSGKKPEGK